MIAVAEKKPVQVYLDQTQLKTLTLLAEKLGTSRAAVLRRGLERLAKEAIPVEEDPALEINRTDGRGCQEPWQSIHGARSYPRSTIVIWWSGRPMRSDGLAGRVKNVTY